MPRPSCLLVLFFFTHPPSPELYTLSLHDALPIFTALAIPGPASQLRFSVPPSNTFAGETELARDRKSTRLNSSHTVISYAVFCLKKKKGLTCRSARARLHALARTEAGHQLCPRFG